MVKQCFKLIPEKALCNTCIQLLFKANGDTRNDVEFEYECVHSNINSINGVCNVLAVSPVTINKFPKERRSCATGIKKKRGKS